MAFKTSCFNYRNMSIKETYDKIIGRIANRAYFFTILNKLFCVIKERNLRMILENPYSEIGYLHDNFEVPTMIDKDRTKRGDYYKKPTQYWFVGLKPTLGYSYQRPPKTLTIRNAKSSGKAGICSEERSLLSSDYARNFIHDFVIGESQIFSQPTLF